MCNLSKVIDLNVIKSDVETSEGESKLVGDDGSRWLEVEEGRVVVENSVARSNMEFEKSGSVVRTIPMPLDTVLILTGAIVEIVADESSGILSLVDE